MRTARWTGLWLAAVIAALVAGGYGSWMISWITGETAIAQVDTCYVYYGNQEIEQVRCDGSWHRGAAAALRSGPVVGVPVTPNPRLADTTTPQPLGYRVDPGAYHRRVFAVLRGDAAVAVPTTNLVLGPLGLAGLLGCLAALTVLTWRDSSRQPSGLLPQQPTPERDPGGEGELEPTKPTRPGAQ